MAETSGSASAGGGGAKAEGSVAVDVSVPDVASATAAPPGGGGDAADVDADADPAVIAAAASVRAALTARSSSFVEAGCERCGLAKERPVRIPLYGAYSRRGLAAGKEHAWCACGLSSTQPLCDGACASWRPTPNEEGSEGEKEEERRTKIPGPVLFTAKAQTLQLLCGCKYTRNPPYCDGVHASMEASPPYAPCRCGEGNGDEPDPAPVVRSEDGRVAW